jgi:hypothetical protein
MSTSAAAVEIRDVEPGLWIWRLNHPHWRPGLDWQPLVTCTCVQAGKETVLLDPLAPRDDAHEFWERLEKQPPTVIAILKPDHVRDADRFLERFRARGFGPRLYFRDDLPKSDLEPIDPGSRLPGGLEALYDGRGRLETPVWCPDHRTIVFADALTEREGALRIWNTPWHEERVLPALRKLLELPFDRVIISHGEPVHSRSEYGYALERTPFGG